MFIVFVFVFCKLKVDSKIFLIMVGILLIFSKVIMMVVRINKIFIIGMICLVKWVIVLKLFKIIEFVSIVIIMFEYNVGILNV